MKYLFWICDKRIRKLVQGYITTASQMVGRSTKEKMEKLKPMEAEQT
jgi:ribosomal protein S17E